MIRYLSILCFIIFSISTLPAHESRPLFVKISEVGGQLDIEVVLPNSVNNQNFPTLSIDSTDLNDTIPWFTDATSFRQRWNLPSIPIKGKLISVKYPIFNPVLSTIISLTLADQDEQILLIPPDQKSVMIPLDANAQEVRWQYSILGIGHIWAGIDHLLFVICLLLITGFNRRLFVTITGFTIAHSITLALSALNIIELPIPPIEATIALSIVFLCYEIIHHHDDKSSLTYRHPILVASSFGLLHGLGFAAVLGEIGLPQKHTIEALLFFNVGVEIGQVIFIIFIYMAFLVTIFVANRLLLSDGLIWLYHKGFRASIYSIGILAAYWMFDRLL